MEPNNGLQAFHSPSYSLHSDGSFPLEASALWLSTSRQNRATGVTRSVKLSRSCRFNSPTTPTTFDRLWSAIQDVHAQVSSERQVSESRFDVCLSYWTSRFSSVRPGPVRTRSTGQVADSETDELDSGKCPAHQTDNRNPSRLWPSWAYSCSASCQLGHPRAL